MPPSEFSVLSATGRVHTYLINLVSREIVLAITAGHQPSPWWDGNTIPTHLAGYSSSMEGVGMHLMLIAQTGVPSDVGALVIAAGVREGLQSAMHNTLLIVSLSAAAGPAASGTLKKLLKTGEYVARSVSVVVHTLNTIHEAVNKTTKSPEIYFNEAAMALFVNPYRRQFLEEFNTALFQYRTEFFRYCSPPHAFEPEHTEKRTGNQGAERTESARDSVNKHITTWRLEQTKPSY